MRITRPDLESVDLTPALATSPRPPRIPRPPHLRNSPHRPHSARTALDPTGLPLADRRVLLYAIGPNSSFHDCFIHAGAMARVLEEGVTIALVCQSDYPHALEEFGLDHWDQIVYLADRRPVLSWPIGMDRCASE